MQDGKSIIHTPRRLYTTTKGWLYIRNGGRGNTKGNNIKEVNNERQAFGIIQQEHLGFCQYLAEVAPYNFLLITGVLTATSLQSWSS